MSYDFVFMFCSVFKIDLEKNARLHLFVSQWDFNLDRIVQANTNFSSN